MGCIYFFELWFSLNLCPGVILPDHMAALFLGNLSLSKCIVSYCSALRQVSAKMVGSSFPAVSGCFHLAMPGFYFIFLTFHQVEISSFFLTTEAT